MGLVERRGLIEKLGEIRGSHVICYLTSLRPNAPGLMSDDAVRVFFDHLLLLPERRVKRLDIYLCSHGGNSVVPWRLVALFREFAESFNVLVPYRAYSAATMLALGADEIVMHPFAELGPIDPKVSNEYNTVENGVRLGINVEDVKSYINFIKSTVGITHEDELVKTIEILVNKVHPLAIGNVERFISQSRMIARKIMRTHMKEADEHVIDEIVENMASKLYFHEHPINRREAKDDLKLKVVCDLEPDLESTMWELYKDFEAEFRNTEPFNPLAEAIAQEVPSPFQQLQLLQQLQQVGTMGPASTMKESQIEVELLHAMIESLRLSSRFITRRRYTYFQNMLGEKQMIHEDITLQTWNHSRAPQA